MKRNYNDKNTIKKPDLSGPEITTTAHSTARHQGGCDKLATGGNTSIKLATKGTTIGKWKEGTLNACCKVHELMQS
ncbi:hypothetical protein DPMN_165681 [Dreissena polymorpha]|uniref:Uncharacterized protein n=1 Tax=Dreissena polymorpha TaxID=45954 RepID=A0A9D4EVS5_DREPO|nr:hypothetical protein DPMN_165681 [Dreissena polymorpha]